MPKLTWADPEIRYVTRHAAAKTIKAMADALGRTEAMVERKVRDLRLRPLKNRLARPPAADRKPRVLRVAGDPKRPSRAVLQAQTDASFREG